MMNHTLTLPNSISSPSTRIFGPVIASLWTQVPFPYQTNATDVAVTLPLTAGNKFYRLRKP